MEISFNSDPCSATTIIPAGTIVPSNGEDPTSEDNSNSEGSSSSDNRPYRAIFISKDDASRKSSLICEDSLISEDSSSSADNSSRNGGYSSDSDPHRDLLTRETSEEASEEVLSEASFVFTAWKPGGHIETRSGVRNADKYVSIEVDLDGSTEDGLLRLRTKRWINGLCFFNGSPRFNVMFPWPAWLTK